jgi:secondary thiamine-phosphate synthase enzyme
VLEKKVMPVQQVDIRLRSRGRGFHLITAEVLAALPMLKEIRAGMVHLFVQHTSASLTINENADPDVRSDMGRWFDRAVPDGDRLFVHTAEGDDDMPAHLKASLLGSSVSIPVRDGRLALGTWQGIYLGEHRDHGGSRSLVVTIWS